MALDAVPRKGYSSNVIAGESAEDCHGFVLTGKVLCCTPVIVRKKAFIIGV
jgi:hypothetical protein